MDPLQPPHPLWQSWTTDVLFLNIIFWVKKIVLVRNSSRDHTGLPHVIHSTALFSQFYILLALFTLGMPAVFCYVFFYLTEQPPLYNFFLQLMVDHGHITILVSLLNAV